MIKDYDSEVSKHLALLKLLQVITTEFDVKTITNKNSIEKIQSYQDWYNQICAEQGEIVEGVNPLKLYLL